jgi:hypothetical protein
VTGAYVKSAISAGATSLYREVFVDYLFNLMKCYDKNMCGLWCTSEGLISSSNTTTTIGATVTTSPGNTTTADNGAIAVISPANMKEGTASTIDGTGTGVEIGDIAEQTDTRASMSELVNTVQRKFVQNCLLGIMKFYTEFTCGACDDPFQYHSDAIAFLSVDSNVTAVTPFDVNKEGNDRMVIDTTVTDILKPGVLFGQLIKEVDIVGTGINYDIGQNDSDGIGADILINIKVSICNNI